MQDPRDCYVKVDDHIDGLYAERDLHISTNQKAVIWRNVKCGRDFKTNVVNNGIGPGGFIERDLIAMQSGCHIVLARSVHVGGKITGFHSVIVTDDDKFTDTFHSFL